MIRSVLALRAAPGKSRALEDPWRVAVSRQLATLLDSAHGHPGAPVAGGLFEVVDEH